MPKVDLSELIPESTLIFENVPDLKGKKHVWTVPPFDEETEIGFWEWRENRMNLRQQEQLNSMGLEDEAEKIKNNKEEPETVGAYWTPLIALAVKKPVLDPETLVHEFHSVTLKRVGQQIVHFFLTGDVFSEKKETEEETQTS